MLLLTSVTKLQSALGTTQNLRAFDLGTQLLLVDGQTLFMVKRTGDLDPAFSGDGVAFLANAKISGLNVVKSGGDLVVSGLQLPSLADPRTFSYTTIPSSGQDAEGATAREVLIGKPLPNASVALPDGSLLLLGETISRVGPTLEVQQQFSSNITSAAAQLGNTAEAFNANRGLALYGAALAPDGKLYLFGSQSVPANLITNKPATSIPAIFRFNLDGSLDDTFRLSSSSILSRLEGQAIDQVQIDHQGRLYLNAYKAVIRLEPNGQLDTLFGQQGLLLPKDLDPVREEFFSSIRLDGQQIYLINSTTYGVEHLLISNSNGVYSSHEIESPLTGIRFLSGKIVYSDSSTVQWLQPNVFNPELYTIKRLSQPSIYQATEDTPLKGVLPGGDDPATERLPYSAERQPSNGTVTVRTDGTFEYRPNDNYFGQDSFGIGIIDAAGKKQTVELQINVASVIDTIRGSAGNDILVGFADADVLLGLGGNDRLRGGGGDDSIDGGDGIDAAVFTGSLANSTITRQGSALSVRTREDGTDTVSNVERLHFSDQALAYDLSGTAGSVAKIIGALLGKQYLSDKGLVGAGLSLMDGGLKIEEAVNLVITQPVFAQLAGASPGKTVPNDLFVKFIYQNITGQAIDSTSQADLVSLLEGGGFTQQSLALLATNHPLTAVMVDLVGLATSGLSFFVAD
jgi:hypothetical protein